MKLISQPKLKTEIIPVLIIIISVIASFYFYAVFPAQVPIHWNISGQPDNYGSPALAAFLLPVILIVVYLLFLFLPNLDPKKERYVQFLPAYHVFKNIFVVFLALIYLIASLNALGYNIRVDLFIPLLVGLLFVIIGYYLPRFKTNWFIGIRTPWTLSSQLSWQKTHVLGGKCFIIAGILMALSFILPFGWRWPVFMAAIIIAALIPIIYSYFVYRQDKAANNGPKS